MKICTKCKEEKELAEFTKNKASKDCLCCWCKDCAREKRKEYYYHRGGKESVKRYSQTEAGKRSHRESDRRRARSIKGKEWRTRYMQSTERKKAEIEREKKRRINYPEKYWAKDAVNKAIKRGDLEKPNKCSLCGKENYKIDGHHTSYKKEDWLKVVWLCRECHVALHSKIKEG